MVSGISPGGLLSMGTGGWMGAGLWFAHAEDGDDEVAELVGLPEVEGVDEGPIADVDELVHAARVAPAINATTRARRYLVVRSMLTTRVLIRDPPRRYRQYPRDEGWQSSSGAISTSCLVPVRANRAERS